MHQTPVRWTSAEAFAAANQLTRKRVIAQILDGHLNGVVSDSDWYVLHFEREDDKDPVLDPLNSKH
jgi:hypothetical protein